jgi:3-phenylpropionate/cinnamic acid dioxygenase small subunit
LDVEHEEIVAVLVRYARAVDAKDWELLRTCFTGDATSDYGDIGSWNGVDELVTFMESAHAGMGPTQHLLSNFQIEVEDRRATSLTYVHAVTVLASHPDDWIDTIGAYEDRLRRGADGWQIDHRRFRTTRTLVSPSLTSAPRRASGEHAVTARTGIGGIGPVGRSPVESALRAGLRPTVLDLGSRSLGEET